MPNDAKPDTKNDPKAADAKAASKNDAKADARTETKPDAGADAKALAAAHAEIERLRAELTELDAAAREEIGALREALSAHEAAARSAGPGRRRGSLPRGEVYTFRARHQLRFTLGGAVKKVAADDTFEASIADLEDDGLALGTHFDLVD